MRVLFDGYWWCEGPISNRAVQREIITEWSKQYPSDQIAVAGPGELHELPSGAEPFRTKLPLQLLMNAVELPRIARTWGADVVVAHNFAVPTKRATSAVFVHDLLFLDHPEWFTAKENAYFRLMPTMTRFADHVFTSSQSEARRITRHLQFPDVVPVGLAMDPELARSAAKQPRLNIFSGSYVLSVGRLNVRKNLSSTIEGAARSPAISPKRPLVIVGESSGREAELSTTAANAIRAGKVIFAGYQSNEELRWLYENAQLFVFLSLDEGFGLPCLEAQTFGVPALVSDIPVFRETLGSSATYVNPVDTEAIGNALTRALAKAVVTEYGDQLAQPSWSGVVERMRARL